MKKNARELAQIIFRDWFSNAVDVVLGEQARVSLRTAIALAIETEREADQWISLQTSLPPEGQVVLWLTKQYGNLPYEKREMHSGKLGHSSKDGLIVWLGLDGNFCYLLHRYSHWMPIPAPPASE